MAAKRGATKKSTTPAGKKNPRADVVKRTQAEKQLDKTNASKNNGLFTDPAEIMSMIADKKVELGDLHQRMEDEYGYFELAEYQAKRGYESFTSTAPKNYFDKILDGVNRAAMTIQVKVDESSKEDERDAANEAELFLLGALEDIDRRNRKRRQKALRRATAFMSCLRGWVAMRAIVYVPEGEEETVFDVVAWDPIHTFWEDGEDGLVWAAHQRKSSKAQIRKKYGYEIEGKDATITDWWDGVNNLILVDDVFVKEPDEDAEHGLDHTPVFIGNVGDMPDIQTKEFSGSGSTNNTLKQQGESVFTTPAGLIEPRNKYISHLMDVAERSRSGSIIHYSKDGKKSIEGNPYRSYTEIKLSIDQKEKIEPLILPPAPPEIGAVFGSIEHDWQQSTLPYPLAYGGTSAAESGRALAIRIEATRSAYSPRTHLLREVYQWLCEEILGQFANPNREAKEVTLDGKNPKMDADQAYFRVTKKPQDIKPDWSIDVIVEPRLPRDEETEINMAIAATRGGPNGEQPLMAMRTARTDILKLRNPDNEEQKVLLEMGQTMRPIMVRRIAKAMEDAGDTEGAQLIMEMAQAEELAQRQSLEQAGVSSEDEAQTERPAATQDDMNLIEAVVAALKEIGREDLGQALVTMLDSQQIDPEVMQQIVQALIEAGQEEIAQALVEAFNGAGPATTTEQQ